MSDIVDMFLNNEISVKCQYCGSLENVTVIDDEFVCSCCVERLFND